MSAGLVPFEGFVEEICSKSLSLVIDDCLLPMSLHMAAPHPPHPLMFRSVFHFYVVTDHIGLGANPNDLILTNGICKDPISK